MDNFGLFVVVDDRRESVSLPRDMVGALAPAAITEQLQIDGIGLKLRRRSDQSWVGDTTSIGHVLRDGDEVELVNPSQA